MKLSTTRRRFTQNLAYLAASVGVTAAAPALAGSVTPDPLTPACRHAFARLSPSKQALVVELIALMTVTDHSLTAEDFAPLYTPAQAAARVKANRDLDR